MSRSEGEWHAHCLSDCMNRCPPLLALLASFLVDFSAYPARADVTEVDLALVLAVDISQSMDEEEQVLQREGFVEAFRSTIVHKAVADGTIGRISVTYMEWAGTGYQRVLVPWTVLDGPDSAKAFADRLAQAPIARAPYTSIAGAIEFGVRLLRESHVHSFRQVIDISGDGINNEGSVVTQARDDAVSRGVTINGLPIMLKRPIGEEVEYLDSYYRDCVIGGVGAFVLPVTASGQLVTGIKTKLILEIAGLEGRFLRSVQRPQAERRLYYVLGKARSWD